MIDDAAAQGAEIILLPEYWSTAFFPATRDYACYALAAPDTGPAITAMKDKAVQHRLHIIATIFERDGTDLCYDTAMLIGPDGVIIGKYRKNAHRWRQTRRHRREARHRSGHRVHLFPDRFPLPRPSA